MTSTTTLHCPAWCEDTHVNDPNGIHDRIVLGSYTGDMFACVALEAEPDVTHPEQTLSPEEATKVAAALAEAVRLAGVTR